MAVTPLASLEDVEEALGRELTSEETARTNSILASASEQFRRESKQLFTAGESLVRLKVNGGEVYLPQRPVTDVLAVTDDAELAIAFSRFGQWLTLRRRSHEFVRVTYLHGGEVPDDVRLRIAEIAMRILNIDPVAVRGVAQHTESVGAVSQSDTFAGWAVGGQTLLAPDDIRFAHSFHFTPPRVIVQRP